jgi:hypothetical protein
MEIFLTELNRTLQKAQRSRIYIFFFFFFFGKHVNVKSPLLQLLTAPFLRRSALRRCRHWVLSRMRSCWVRAVKQPQGFGETCWKPFAVQICCAGSGPHSIANWKGAFHPWGIGIEKSSLSIITADQTPNSRTLKERKRKSIPRFKLQLCTYSLIVPA